MEYRKPKMKIFFIILTTCAILSKSIQIDESLFADDSKPNRAKAIDESVESFEFQAEVNRLMNIIINSLYKNKDIFLRELISNAADALDKIRLESLTNKSVLDTGEKLEIRISYDEDAKVLHIADTGIGMTKNELIKNLGTIAKSGTTEFFEKISEQAASGESMSDLIGQFGVGFYSSFLVAEQVYVTSKHNDDDQYIWWSDSTTFNVKPDPEGNTLQRGTVISLKLMHDSTDYLDTTALANLIQKYSQFINFPIYLHGRHYQELPGQFEEVEQEEEEIDDDYYIDEAFVGEEDPTKNSTISTRPKKGYVTRWKLMNDVKPIWTRMPQSVPDTDYINFYHSICKDKKDPLTWTHFKIEGDISFKALLYLPAENVRGPHSTIKASSDMIKLYIRRVYITDDFRDMLPNYLGVVRGVVDSDDLPLNIGRETLQQHKLLKVIKRHLTKKTIDMIKRLNETAFDKFYKEYSTNIKIGVIEDNSNRNKLAKLLKVNTTSDVNVTSIADYVDRMKPGQTEIYFSVERTLEEARHSVFVEKLVEKGYEILLMSEPIDEYTMHSLVDFDGKKFRNVAKDGLEMPDADETLLNTLKVQFEPLTSYLKANLKAYISKVRISQALTTSPAALVAKKTGWSGNYERLRRSQAYERKSEGEIEYFEKQRPILEINPEHAIIRDLLQRVSADPNDPELLDTTQLLFGATKLRSGYDILEKAEFAKLLEGMISQQIGTPAGRGARREEL